VENVLDVITEKISQAFEACGYQKDYGMVVPSNRPDLCEYQCNGAMAAAKAYKKAPILIAREVAEKLADDALLEEVNAVMPGFINIKLSKEYLAHRMAEMAQDVRLGCPKASKPLTIIVDYGGANVAKPLHVGHLRSAVIGESLKRIARFFGHRVIGDVHLGDFGLQMGLVIEELRGRKPELPYFDKDYVGEYPSEPPFTLEELEEIYPAASAKSKVDEEFKNRAHKATRLLQDGEPAYRALWKHIMAVSISDLKKNYDSLDVHFDLWNGESDVQPLILEMVEDLMRRGIARESQNAIVVDVAEESDAKEVPPCLIQKSDGAALYATSDLATIVEREQKYHPDRYLYVVDKRQELHFIQVFRAAKKAGMVKPDAKLEFIGFGTMNGKDGKPFKTREGGVLRLEYLIQEINNAVYAKMMENQTTSEEEARKTAGIIGLSALKYGDLSNQASKDYVFDMERFTAFEGNTGPYLLYTIVRIKSILAKYEQSEHVQESSVVYTAEQKDTVTDTGVGMGSRGKIMPAASDGEKALMLEISKLNDVLEHAYEENAPHKICQYIYGLSDAFNRFYHETKILAEEDRIRKESWIALLSLTERVLELGIELLGFTAPERM
jgi:arginyl-tRNA synthetase